VGKDADIVIFDEVVNISHTIIGGEVFYEKQ
jgi:N-acetylglucosamine-6-phosphate deacetylase